MQQNERAKLETGCEVGAWLSWMYCPHGRLRLYLPDPLASLVDTVAVALQASVHEALSLCEPYLGCVPALARHMACLR
jgi:hypothetical protein